MARANVSNLSCQFTGIQQIGTDGRWKFDAELAAKRDRAEAWLRLCSITRCSGKYMASLPLCYVEFEARSPSRRCDRSGLSRDGARLSRP